MQEFIKAETEMAEKAKVASKGRPAAYRMRLVLTETQRDKFKKAFKQLGEKKASKIVYKAVLDAAK